MKDMTGTGKAEKHGKLMRMRIPMVRVIMMGTLKEISGKIDKVLRWKYGTLGKIHSNGLHRQLLPQMHPTLLGLLPMLPGVASLKTPTAQPDHLIQHHSIRLRHHPQAPHRHSHLALDRTMVRLLVRLPVRLLVHLLVCLLVRLAGKIGEQKPWQWLITDVTFNLRLSPMARDTAIQIASPSLTTILTPLSRIRVRLLHRRSA
jgi:hypothetical protein